MRILFYHKIIPGSSYDILRTVDYETLYDDVRNQYNDLWSNSGNKLWFQGIISELSTEDNEIFFLQDDYSWDFINNSFDAIVYSSANIFQKRHQEEIDKFASIFRNSKIPVFVISCGAQGQLNEHPRDVVVGIEKSIASFFDSIYSCGGELSLRGQFTKDVLDCVMPNTAKVTGCPSLFQNGRDLHISNEKVDFESFNVAVNGNKFLSSKLITGKSWFVDQDVFAREMYDIDFLNSENKEFIKHCIISFGLEKTKILFDGKIQLFMDVPEWLHFMKSEKITFSFGSRIHGNILPLLGGIPSLIYPIDSRVQEMAAFYNIPTTQSHPTNIKELYDLYLKTDYSGFNQKFGTLFDDFNQFMVDCGLVKNSINTNNLFFNRELPNTCEIIESRYLKISQDFSNHYGEYWAKDKIRKAFNKLKI